MHIGGKHKIEWDLKFTFTLSVTFSYFSLLFYRRKTCSGWFEIKRRREKLFFCAVVSPFLFILSFFLSSFCACFTFFLVRAYYQKRAIYFQTSNNIFHASHLEHNRLTFRVLTLVFFYFHLLSLSYIQDFFTV